MTSAVCGNTGLLRCVRNWGLLLLLPVILAGCQVAKAPEGMRLGTGYGEALNSGKAVILFETGHRTRRALVGIKEEPVRRLRFYRMGGGGTMSGCPPESCLEILPGAGTRQKRGDPLVVWPGKYQLVLLEDFDRYYRTDRTIELTLWPETPVVEFEVKAGEFLYLGKLLVEYRDRHDGLKAEFKLSDEMDLAQAYLGKSMESSLLKRMQKQLMTLQRDIVDLKVVN